MDYRELLEKYNLLLSENRRLIEENDTLNAQLGKAERRPDEDRIAEPTTEKRIRDDEPKDSTLFSCVINISN
jgi:regulator of replication initiation timing